MSALYLKLLSSFFSLILFWLFSLFSNRLRFWPHLTHPQRPTPRCYQGLTCPGLQLQQLWGPQPLTLWQSKVQALEIQSLGLECLEIQPLLDWPRPHKVLLLFSWSLWAFHQAYGLRYRKIIFIVIFIIFLCSFLSKSLKERAQFGGSWQFFRFFTR